MSKYEINYGTLRDIDEYLSVESPDKLDDEIEDILAVLWKGAGKCQELLSPLFTTYLQSDLLRPLYIHYLALRELQNRYESVVVNASTVIIDIVGKHLGFEFNPHRSFHDEEFFLIRHYDFSISGRRRRAYWKRVLLSLGGACMGPVCRFKGIDVLYLNAGKLDDDLSRIPRAMSALWIPLRRSGRSGCDAHAISKQVRENVKSMNLSIPQELVAELVEKRVLAYLPDALDRVGALTEFIEQYKVKLVIASTVTHENHLCLLAAAKLAGVESLVVAHGVTLAKNPFLDHYVTYQATLNNIEPRYVGAFQFPLRLGWFERKV